MTKLTDTRTTPFIWIHLEALEIFKGNPTAAFVYLHIVKRAGHEGKCWQSIDRMAEDCGLSTGTLKRSLSFLLSAGMVVRCSRSGKTSIYQVTEPPKWKLPGSNLTQVKNDPGRRAPGSNLTQVGGSNLTQVPGSNLTHELDPNELDPNELDPSVCEARKNLTTDNANSPHTIEFEITDTLTDTEPVANSYPVNSNQTGVEPEDLDLPAVPPQIFSAAPAVFSPSPSETASISAEKQIQVSNDIQPVNGVLRGNFGAIVPLGKFLEVYNRSCGNWKPLSVAPAPAIVQGISAYRTRFVGTDDEFFKFFPLLIQAAQRSGGWFKQKLSPSQVFNAERLPLLDVWDEAGKPDPVVHAVPVPNNFNHVQFENFL